MFYIHARRPLEKYSKEHGITILKQESVGRSILLAGLAMFLYLGFYLLGRVDGFTYGI